jgi:hypothetical protein
MTGKITFQIDKKSTHCPYLAIHDGKKCAIFVKMCKPKKTGIFERLFRKRLPPD